MKKYLTWFLSIIPWLFFFIFLKENTFIKTIKRPLPIPFWLFTIITLFSIFLITYSVFLLHKEYSYKETKEYNRYLIVFYLFFQGIFFSLTLIENVFISFSCAIITVLASLFLYYESKSYNRLCTKYLCYPIYYNIILCFLLLITYFINL